MKTPFSVHATAVALPDADEKYLAILLRGPSGCGKSDLALRLIDAGGMLVADDQVVLSALAGHVLASPPEPLKGLIEVRGVGLCQVPFRAGVRVAAVVDLVPRDAVPRLPAADTVDLLDIALPRFYLHAFDASAVAKIRALLAVVKAPEKVIR